MYATANENGNPIIITEGEKFDRVDEALVAVMNTLSDPIEVCNEGWPINAGNLYAYYLFTAFIDGLVYTFPFGSDELDALNKGELKLVPEGDNWLEFMPEGIRPEWA